MKQRCEKENAAGAEMFFPGVVSDVNESEKVFTTVCSNYSLMHSSWQRTALTRDDVFNTNGEAKKCKTLFVMK